MKTLSQILDQIDQDHKIAELFINRLIMNNNTVFNHLKKSTETIKISGLIISGFSWSLTLDEVSKWSKIYKYYL